MQQAFLSFPCRCFARVQCCFVRLKLRENGRNIVGQQLPTLLDVTCCVRLHTLLHVVECRCAKFETSQTFQPTTPNISFVSWSPKCSTTMFDPFAQLFQRCWGRARSLCMVYKDLWVVSFPRCTAGPNIVGSCCIRLHTTANTHATTPNIVGATMLEVVASVCTQPKTSNFLVTHYFYGGIVVWANPIFCFLCSCSLLVFTAAHFHLAGR